MEVAIFVPATLHHGHTGGDQTVHVQKSIITIINSQALNTLKCNYP